MNCYFFPFSFKLTIPESSPLALIRYAAADNSESVIAAQQNYLDEMTAQRQNRREIELPPSESDDSESDDDEEQDQVEYDSMGNIVEKSAGSDQHHHHRDAKLQLGMSELGIHHEEGQEDI